MNKLLLLLFIPFCFLVVSCNKENECEYLSEEPASLRFYVSNQGASLAIQSRGSVFDATPEESKIEDMVVLCYERADGNMGKYIGYNKINVANVLNKGMFGNYELKQVDWNKSDFMPQADCEILVLANCIDNGLTLVDIDKKAKEAQNIHELQYCLKADKEIIKAQNSLIMSARGVFSAKSGAILSLERSVAKVRITLSAALLQAGYEIGNTYWVNQRDSTYVLNVGGDSPHTLESGLSAPWATIQKGVVQSYVYETFNTAHTKYLGFVIGLSYQGVMSFYKMNINEKNGQQKITRNSLYQIDLVKVSGYGAESPSDAIDGASSSKLGMKDNDWDDSDGSLYFEAKNGVGIIPSCLSIDKKVKDLSLNASLEDTIFVYWKDFTSSADKATNDLKLSSDYKYTTVRHCASSSWSEPDSIFVKYTQNSSFSTALVLAYEDLTVKIPINIDVIATGMIVAGNLMMSPDPVVNDVGSPYFLFDQHIAYNDFCPKGWHIPTLLEARHFFSLFSLSVYDDSPVMTAKNKSARIIFNLGRFDPGTSTPSKVRDECYFIVFDEALKENKLFIIYANASSSTDFETPPDNYLYPLRCVRSYN